MASGFCGQVAGAAGWLLAGTLNPCYFNTTAAAVLALAAAASALVQGSFARRLAAAARGRDYLLPRPSGAVAHAQLGAAAVLIALHGFALLWSVFQVPQPAYIDLSESLLLLAWSAFVVSAQERALKAVLVGRMHAPDRLHGVYMPPSRLPAAAADLLPPSYKHTQALMFYCRRLGAPTRLRMLMWTATALYTFGLYSEARQCRGASGWCIPLTPFPPVPVQWCVRVGLCVCGRHDTADAAAGLASVQCWIKLHHCFLCYFPTHVQIQFYVHGLGMNPSERRFRLTAAVVMEAAVLVLLATEYRK